MVVVSGALTKKVQMLPLAKVTDMSLRHLYTGRLLRFGEFIIESARRDQALQTVDHIPYSQQLYLEVCGLNFKGSDDADS
jgi:hypothetical protein